MDKQPISPLLHLDSPFADKFRHALFSMVKMPLSKILRLETLNSMYTELKEKESDEPFIDKALEILGVKFTVGGQPLSRIPKTGPVVAVCNHPFGVLEGLMLAKAIREVRPDIRIMANGLLGMIPEMKDILIQVDPFGRDDSAKKNIAGLKASMKWLREGGLLVIFPAGEVSSLHVRKARVADPQWSPMVGRIIRKTGASALPVFFEGRNSGVFQTLGLIHPSLRTVLLPNENLKHAMKHPLRLTFGSVVDSARVGEFESDIELTDYLRFRTYLLRKGSKRAALASEQGSKRQAPIANSRGRHILASEVAALPDENILLKSGDFTVFHAGAFNIPRLLREIGIQREITFRAVGEGTGKAMDIDEFDDTYRHLVLWNHRENEVAGAYRFGLTDELLKEHGPKGLYTSTLFNYRPGFLESMGPALEMGRSFIVPKYQKAYQPLLLLWKGVAAFVVANPRYSRLFGCVSISADYSGLSRELIMGFMGRHCNMPELSGMAIPKNPPTVKSLPKVDLRMPDVLFNRFDDIGDLISDVEDGKSIPVLLRQYLKLGGKIIGFNVDPDFNDCLDGLILVDLLKSDPKTLGRFMGKDGVEEFLAAHPKPVSDKVVPIRQGQAA